MTANVTSVCGLDAIRASIKWLLTDANPHNRKPVESLRRSHVLNRWAKAHKLDLSNDSNIERLKPFQAFCKDEFGVVLTDTDLLHLLQDHQGLIGKMKV